MKKSVSVENCKELLQNALSSLENIHSEQFINAKLLFSSLLDQINKYSTDIKHSDEDNSTDWSKFTEQLQQFHLKLSAYIDNKLSVSDSNILNQLELKLYLSFLQHVDDIYKSLGIDVFKRIHPFLQQNDEVATLLSFRVFGPRLESIVSVECLGMNLYSLIQEKPPLSFLINLLLIAIVPVDIINSSDIEFSGWSNLVHRFGPCLDICRKMLSIADLEKLHEKKTWYTLPFYTTFTKREQAANALQLKSHSSKNPWLIRLGKVSLNHVFIFSYFDHEGETKHIPILNDFSHGYYAQDENPVYQDTLLDCVVFIINALQNALNWSNEIKILNQYQNNISELVNSHYNEAWNNEHARLAELKRQEDEASSRRIEEEKEKKRIEEEKEKKRIEEEKEKKRIEEKENKRIEEEKEKKRIEEEKEKKRIQEEITINKDALNTADITKSTEAKDENKHKESKTTISNNNTSSNTASTDVKSDNNTQTKSESKQQHEPQNKNISPVDPNKTRLVSIPLDDGKNESKNSKKEPLKPNGCCIIL